jgi:hypothetical protein
MGEKMRENIQFLWKRINDIEAVEPLISMCGGGCLVLENHRNFYKASIDFLKTNSVEEFEKTLRTKPGILGMPEAPIIEDILAFIQNGRGLFESVQDYPLYIDRRQQKIVEELSKQWGEDAARRTAARKEAELEAKKKSQIELAEKLGIPCEQLEKLQGVS